MSFWSSFNDFIFPPFEQKSSGNTRDLPTHSVEAIEAAVRADGGDSFGSTRVSTVFACARVIAEGLAQPPCYIVQDDGRGTKRALNHPLNELLTVAPNERQTSYEFREMLGWHLALSGNAYVFINRNYAGDIQELFPVDLGQVTVSVDESRLGNPVQYYLYGVAVPSENIWHLKGSSLRSHRGMSPQEEAATAIALARATETFGSALFKNGAKPGALITPKEAGWTSEQVEQIKSAWEANRGAANAHKTSVMNAQIEYTPMSNNASDSQWIDARRFAVEEVCRYFRVSPAKVFHTTGSQSYASVEQAHIAHDQDTDAQWHERFVQSANKALLRPSERKAGHRIIIDNRAALRGTAVERMTYYQFGLQNGIFTQNEAREMEGFDRSDDPAADKLRTAANLYGDGAQADQRGE